MPPPVPCTVRLPLPESVPLKTKLLNELLSTPALDPIVAFFEIVTEDPLGIKKPLFNVKEPEPSELLETIKLPAFKIALHPLDEEFPFNLKLPLPVFVSVVDPVIGLLMIVLPASV